MDFNRKQFNGTNAEQLKASPGAVKDGPPFFSHEAGNNYYRVAPSVGAVRAMAGEKFSGEPYVTDQCQLFLPVPTDKEAKGTDSLAEIKERYPKLTGNFQMTPVYNARVHGGYSLDLIEEYKKAVEKKLSGGTGFLSGDQNKLVFFLRHRHSHLVYAYKIPNNYTPAGEAPTKEFGVLPLSPTLYSSLRQLATSVATPEVPDAISNPDGGVVINIHKDESERRKGSYSKVYSCALATYGVQTIQLPLLDEDLEFIYNQKPLRDQFGNCFSRKDYDAQVSFLKCFDEASGYGILKEKTSPFSQSCKNFADEFSAKVGDAPEGQEAGEPTEEDVF